MLSCCHEQFVDVLRRDMVGWIQIVYCRQQVGGLLHKEPKEPFDFCRSDFYEPHRKTSLCIPRNDSIVLWVLRKNLRYVLDLLRFWRAAIQVTSQKVFE